MEERDGVETPQAPGSATVGPARPRDAQPDDLPPDAPDGLRKAAEGGADRMTVGEERDALDFLLGATKPVEYDVPVKYDTSAGRKELTFRIRQLDGKVILKLEDSHKKGTGPFAELDDIAFNAALVAEATVFLTDASGREVDPKGHEFIGDLGFGPAEAMEVRFKFQPGILDGVAGQIRSISGYSPDRVGAAERAADKTKEALGG